jgi:hypothetical protein
MAEWDAQMLRDILNSRGIDAIVEDRFELYVPGADRVLILNDSDEPRAMEVVGEFRANLARQPADTRMGWGWQCPACREDVEPQFAVCWNCGAEKPGA